MFRLQTFEEVFGVSAANIIRTNRNDLTNDPENYNRGCDPNKIGHKVRLLSKTLAGFKYPERRSGKLTGNAGLVWGRAWRRQAKVEPWRPGWHQTTWKKSARLFNNEQQANLPFFNIFIGRRDRAILNGLGGSDSICHLAVFSICTRKCGLPIQAMVLKYILRHFREGLPVLPFTGLLLGLGFYSYHIRELLVCWLFLGLLFAVLTLAALGVLLAGHAARYLATWIRAAAAVAPELAICPAEPRQESVPDPRILAAGPLNVAAGRHPSAEELEVRSGQLIEAAASTEGYVLN